LQNGGRRKQFLKNRTCAVNADKKTASAKALRLAEAVLI
jgi:hypothetical protein